MPDGCPRAPSSTVRERLAERWYRDARAPVMGNPKVVEAGHDDRGHLRPADAFETPGPYLSMLGRDVTYVGGGELAHIVKLCTTCSRRGRPRRWQRLVSRAGKRDQPRGILACLNKSVVGSQFTQYKTPAYVNLDSRPTFTSQAAAQGFRPWAGSRARARGADARDRPVRQLIQGLVGGVR